MSEKHAVRQQQLDLGEKTTTLVLHPAKLKIHFAFLNESKLEKADYRLIAFQAGVTLGNISGLMSKLCERDFLAENSKKERRLLKKPELLKIWVEGFIERVCPKLLLAHFETASAISGKWWEAVDLKSENAVWEGEVGRHFLTDYLKPQTVTIYANTVLPHLQAKFGLHRPTAKWRFRCC